MINDIVLQKLQSLDETINELRSLGKVTIVQLESDWLKRRAIERDLQVMVEVVIDICQRLLSLEGQTPATTGVDAVKRCIQMGALTDLEAYRKMVQFRNFIVYRYEHVDIEILVDMVNNRLEDFESFKKEILAYEKD